MTIAVDRLLKRTGYCPYCGGELIPATYLPSCEWLEWTPCKRELCPGAMVTVTTDTHGFIIFPKRKEGSYVYKRPSRSGRER